MRTLQWIAVLICARVVASSVKSHYGTEFYISSVPNSSGPLDTYVTVDISSTRAGTAELAIPYLNTLRNFTLTRGSNTVNISSSLLAQGTFLEKRCVRIRSDVIVAVYVTTVTDPFSMDTYLTLPVSSLGTQYTVGSYEPYSYSGYVAYISVIGTRDNTNISIRFKNQTVLSRTLQEFSVYQLVDIHDLTDTYITSDQPVAVVSSVVNALVPHSIDFLDFLQEQMLPMAFWKTQYIVPPLFPKTAFVLKVLTVNSTSKFCLTNLTRTQCNLSSKSPRDEFVMQTEPVVVTSSSPISVVQYGVGQAYEGIQGDPFMMDVQAVDNYLSQYYFTVPEFYSTHSNYLSVIVPISEVINILLDGSTLNILRQYSVPPPFNDYTVLTSRINAGYHDLRHRDNRVKFGAYVYGFRNHTGYGYPAGFLFASDDGQVCFQCDDMSGLMYCDSVRQCGLNEVCYAEKYVSSSGTYFKSGCISRDLCGGNMTKNSNTVCGECCYDNFCNNKGCEDNRFPDRNQRGPMCYDCLHVENPELCNKVTLCASNEVCSIHQYRWGDDFHYKMGCSHPMCVPVKRSVSHDRQQRSTPFCSRCCSDDFCNHFCTTSTGDGSNPQIVG